MTPRGCEAWLEFFLSNLDIFFFFFFFYPPPGGYGTPLEPPSTQRPHARRATYGGHIAGHIATCYYIQPLRITCPPMPAPKSASSHTIRPATRTRPCPRTRPCGQKSCQQGKNFIEKQRATSYGPIWAARCGPAVADTHYITPATARNQKASYASQAA